MTLDPANLCTSFLNGGWYDGKFDEDSERKVHVEELKYLTAAAAILYV
jgi:hypothetical protein